MDGDAQARARVMEHWQASEQGDSTAEHAIYAADAILDYPQSGERFRGRETIAAQRGGHPAERHFTVVRISGHGDLWVSEVRDHLRRGTHPLGQHHGVLRQSRRP